MPDGRPWPRISIITASYNQGRFIEETIRSVLLQGYPDIEYFIMDGASRDKTSEIVGAYGRWITKFVSEPDDGNAYAINNGWRLSTGEIIGLQASDDLYEPGALHAAALSLASHPTAAMTFGRCAVIDAKGSQTGLLVGSPWSSRESLRTMVNNCATPSAFIRSSALAAVGFMDPGAGKTIDWELWLRLSLVGDIQHESAVWARFRLHDASVTGRQRSTFGVDKLRIIDRLFADSNTPMEFREVEKESRASGNMWAMVDAYRRRDWGATLEHLRKSVQYGGIRFAPRLLRAGMHMIIGPRRIWPLRRAFRRNERAVRIRAGRSVP
ncbi:MAG: glycosyltransferase [Euryarchaeota archaeon]|nr:glycosyltransferase [Euryarchaeota archaeon]